MMNEGNQQRTGEDSTFASILIAEDDDQLRETLMALFAQLGFDPYGVSTGDQFFEWTEPMLLGESGHWQPDLILTDVNMPGIPPIEVVDGLRRVGRLVPVVVISGLRDQKVRRMVEGMGIRWLSKPLDALRLERAVRSALAEHYRNTTL